MCRQQQRIESHQGIIDPLHEVQLSCQIKINLFTFHGLHSKIGQLIFIALDVVVLKIREQVLTFAFLFKITFIRLS